MKKKTVSLAFVLTLLTLLMLVSFVRASVGPLQFVATITLDKEPECIAVNEATNRIYVGVEDGLLVIDCDSYAAIANITLEAEVIGLAINPQTNRIYAVVSEERVVVIDGATSG
jgi:DNA-binding beta-propeller fold protein YncE